MRLVLVGLLASLLFGQPEVFVVNENGRSVQPILTDPVRPLDPFPTPNAPAFFFVSADRTKYYSISRSATATVAVLSAAQPSTVLKTFDLAAVTAAVMTPDRSQLVIATANTLYRIDTTTDTIAGSVFLNAPVKEVIASLDGSRVFALATQVSMYRISPFVLQSTTVLPGPLETMALNHTGLLYASAQSRVYEIDGTTGEPLRTIETPGRPGRLAFSPSGRVALAGSKGPGPSLFRLDLQAGVVSGTLSTTDVPFERLVFVGESRALGISGRTFEVIPVTLEPLSAPPVMYSTAVWQDILPSPEFPGCREIYYRGLHVNSSSSSDFPATPLVNLNGPGTVVVAPVAAVGVPAHLYAYNGDQTALPGQPYRRPLIVRVTNRVGRPLGNVSVQFSNGQTATSNREGWAQISATAPPSGGASMITAMAGEARAIFRLGTPSAPPAAIVILEGQGQLVDNRSPRPKAIRIAVRDAAGFPAPDTEVTFSASSGAGTLDCTGGALCSVKTDGSGLATMALKIGPGFSGVYHQQQRIVVSAGAAPTRTIFFTVHTATEDLALQEVAPVRTIASGLVNTTVASATAYRVMGRFQDNIHRPIPNVGVSYQAPLTHPDLRCEGEGGVALGDDNGLARCSMALGGIQGTAPLTTRTLLGSLPAPTLAATSRVAILAAGLPVLQVLAGADQRVRGGVPPTPITIRLVDGQGVPMPNQPLTWSVEGAGQPLQLISPPSQTNGAGEASAGIATLAPGSFSTADYTVKVAANGAAVEIPIHLEGSANSPNPLSINLPGRAGTARTEVIRDGPWTIEGLPNWLRTATPAGISSRHIWFEFDANPSRTESRRVTLIIGGRPVEIVQEAPRPPSISRDLVFSSSGEITTIRVGFFGNPDANTLNVLNILIRDSLDGRNACYIAYSMPQRVLYLVSDQGPESLSAPIFLPSQQSLSNRQCTIHGAESLPPNLIGGTDLRLRISFAPSFAGPKVVYAGATDIYGISSGWSIVGAHLVPAPASWPRPVSVTPPIRRPSDFLIDQTLEFEDATNARNLETVWMLSNTALDAPGACYLAYHVPSNQLFLFPDSGVPTGITSTSLAVRAELRNSSCLVSTDSAVVSVAGNRLRLTLKIAYLNQVGPRAIWLAAKSLSGQVSSWQALGVYAPP